ncbi:uncharacterized protein LOC133191829 [Saccostrea echinata]|uniref:uncharacterized protein LOC133175422 n=1 Tax=Saccostrea echinata TaxID=191078 RepID=UPI002A83DF53|nr:uncharacterized protein LOC133175422 [Saccostrea echinata]XP_061183541.1 uncharacterized protein LOC133191829 [Saccostrea echinata]
MANSLIYLVLILSVHFLGSIECSCKMYTEGADGYNVVRDDKGVKLCIYVDQAGRSVEVNVNRTHRHPTDCEDCKCQPSGDLHCCMYGAKAGKTSYPSTCTLVKVGNCDHKLVLKSDEKTPCIQGPIYPPSTTISVNAETRVSNQSTPTSLQRDPKPQGGDGAAVSLRCFPPFLLLFGVLSVILY